MMTFLDEVNLECSLSISEWGEVASGVLLVHGLSSENLSNHISHDSHHSGTSVVKLGIKLAGFLFWVLDVVSEPTDTVVSIVLGSGHPGELNKSEEEKDLKKSGSWDSTDSVNSSGDITELEVGGWGKVSVEGDVVVVYDGSNYGSHGNTSVLALNSTTTFEVLGFSVEPSKRVINSKRGSGSKLKLVNHFKGRRSLATGGRGEGGGRSGEEGGDGELHC